MTGSTSPARGGEGGLARTAGFQSAKGAGIIAVAVLVGVVLLNVVDDGSSGPIGNGKDDGKKAAATTTTVKQSSGGTTTTTKPTAPAKNPDQVRVLVLNGGAPAGAAGDMADALKQKGYSSQEPANDDDETRDGNVVYCKAGFEREASALAVAVGEGTPVEVFPDPAPPKSDPADCVVVVGA